MRCIRAPLHPVAEDAAQSTFNYTQGNRPSTFAMATMMKPTNCHLWQMKTLTSKDLHGCFELVEEMSEEDSHYRRALLRCKSCGQLYLYEFYEWIEWEGGNDPQYQTWIPVASREEAVEVNKADYIELLKFSPRLQSDFPKDASEPKVFWVGRNSILGFTRS